MKCVNHTCHGRTLDPIRDGVTSGTFRASPWFLLSLHLGLLEQCFSAGEAFSSGEPPLHRFLTRKTWSVIRLGNQMKIFAVQEIGVSSGDNLQEGSSSLCVLGLNTTDSESSSS